MAYETGTCTDHLDFMQKLNTFLLKGHPLPPTYTGTGTGLLTGAIGTASSVQEVITITFTSSTAFNVAGSVSGALGSGTVGTLFTHAKVSFTVTAGGTAWAASDTIVFTMTPPWTRLRWSGGQALYNSGFSTPANVYDGSSSTVATVVAGSLPASIGIQLMNAEEVRSFTVQGAVSTVNNSPNAFVLEWSDDGTAWTAAQTYTGQTAWTGSQVRSFDVSSAPGTHKWWRLRFTANNGGTTLDVAEVNFYTATGVPATALIPWSMEAIYSAPGNGSDITNYVGFKLWADAGGDYWNWRLGAFTGYTAGTAFASLPGAMTRPMLTLWNGSTTYWFNATGRRVVVVAKVSTVYVSAYLGLMLPYASATAYPYPQVCGGNLCYNSEPAVGNAGWRWSTTNGQLENWPMASGSYSVPLDLSMQLRKADGTWQGFQRHTINQAVTGIIQPYAPINTAVENGMVNLRENLDGSYPLLPIFWMETVFQSAGSRQVYGEPEGIMATTGHNMTSESTITVGRDTWIAFQNVNKTGKNQFFAMLAS